MFKYPSSSAWDPDDHAMPDRAYVGTMQGNHNKASSVSGLQLPCSYIAPAVSSSHSRKTLHPIGLNVPAKLNVPSLLLSKGGAHLLHSACPAGKTDPLAK